ncbi:DUF983 domain-containing protein [Roseibium litorale]|uniref:DUF983 domain-containing protein n=1 Tax=Roseibium litorale TaxID=2803841 RepID=A0ABR9CGT8_9HYPH|nr:DUF983 domain-containing protein [Roseibium litorale]MBD8890089.1 DUF983 domain-containing protein [Roseibium litorale]
MSVHYSTASGIEAEDVPKKPRRAVMPALLRGCLCRCPACGKGKLFKGYLTTVHACEACGQAIHHHRADDAPPYFTITIVGHIIVPGMLTVELLYHPELWVHMVLWVPLTILLSLGLLRPVKGALIGLQWALYMHGFDPEAGEDLPEPDPAGRLRTE